MYGVICTLCVRCNVYTVYASAAMKQKHLERGNRLRNDMKNHENRIVILSVEKTFTVNPVVILFPRGYRLTAAAYKDVYCAENPTLGEKNN